MEITLLRDCNVRLEKGTTLTVDEKEAARLVAFGLATVKVATRKPRTARAKTTDTKKETKK